MGAGTMTAFAIFCLLNAIDGYLTVRVLDRGGSEANPVMRRVMERLGTIPALVAVKAPLLALVYAYSTETFTAVLCAVYVLLCAWNAWVLSRL